MKLAGKMTALVGVVMLIVATFLKYESNGEESLSLWQGTTRFPVILTVLAVAAAVLITISFFVDRWGLPFATAAIGFLCVGETFPLLSQSYTPFRVGFWLSIAGSVVIALGATLALIGTRARAVAPAAAPTRGAGIAAPAAGAPRYQPQMAQPSVPAGWYPDPYGQGQERYWNGSAWSGNVRAGGAHVR